MPVDISQVQAQNGVLVALNPKTGQMEQVYADPSNTGEGSTVDFQNVYFKDEAPAGAIPMWEGQEGTAARNFLLSAAALAGGAAVAPAGVGGAAGAGVGEGALGAGAFGGMDAAALGAADFGSGALTLGAGDAALVGGAGADVLGAEPIISNFAPTGGAFNPMTGAPLSSTLGTGGSVVSNLTGLDPNLVNLAGTAGAVGLGIYGANQTADALGDISAAENARIQQLIGFGAPYRDDLLALQNDPDSFYTSPMVTGALDRGTQSLARTLSMQGNPALSGSSLHALQDYTTQGLLSQYGAERDRLAGYGGLTAYAGGAARGPDLSPSIGSVNAQGGAYDALGYGLSQLTSPRRSLSQMLGLV